MSCRRIEGLDDDTPCYIFCDGKAVRISREAPHERLYIFDGEGEYTSWKKHLESNEKYSLAFKDVADMLHKEARQ